jgi:hypothetical protein
VKFGIFAREVWHLRRPSLANYAPKNATKATNATNATPVFERRKGAFICILY